jgi:hypothetical protein
MQIRTLTSDDNMSSHSQFISITHGRHRRRRRRMNRFGGPVDRLEVVVALARCCVWL